MELEEDADPMDPERLVQCPLVKHHQIRARRFPYHLVKCKKNNPDIAKKLSTCPFNARHLVPHADLSDHIAKCDYKALVDQDVEVSRSCQPPQEQLNNGSTWQAPPCTEDWDAELLETPEPPFVWGAVGSAISSTLSNQTNLPSWMRPPKSLPFSMSAGQIQSVSSSSRNLVLPKK